MNYFQQVQIPEKGIYFTQFVQEIKRYHLLWHKEITLIVILSGEIELSVNGQICTLTEDDVAIIGSNQTFSTLSQNKGSLALMLNFDPQLISRYVSTPPPFIFSGLSDSSSRNEERFVRLRGYNALIMQQAAIDSPGAILTVEAAFMMLLNVLLRDFPPKSADEHSNFDAEHRLLAFDRILNYINQNFKNDITLSDIAKIGNYNPSYVSHLFKEKIGIGFREYLTRRRLQSAVAELNHTDKSMSAVARDNGFSDIKSFYLNFEKMYHKTPLQYKKQMLAGAFSNIRLQVPQLQHNYSEARILYPYSPVEEKLSDYVSKLASAI